MSRFHESTDVVSWGRVVRSPHCVSDPVFRDELPPVIEEARRSSRSLLATGLRRSYGDSGLNAGGALIDMSRLDRFITFDSATGFLTAEAGVSLAQILDFAIPRGLFLPVTPGTRFVTLGGAVANDVHGKNHHSAGTFGRWVREIGLRRSNGTTLRLTPSDETGLFAATVGGLGLTGVITDVTLELKRIGSSRLMQETISFGRLVEFFELVRESRRNEYTVSWIDCLASGASLGRGLFTRADSLLSGPLEVSSNVGPKVPFEMPRSLLNRLSIGGLNALYYGMGRLNAGRRVVDYSTYFYPLDAIGGWNKLYGRRGMYQYQSVVPPAGAEPATAEMLKAVAKAGEGSFLVVLKTFGSLTSPGMLSFPMEGTTLALDFPNRGASTLQLLDRLDAIVREAGGRLYPAKDGRLPAAMFRAGYPMLDAFAQHVDPGISSSFWRRMQD